MIQIRRLVVCVLAIAACSLHGTAARHRQLGCVGFRASKACSTGQPPADSRLFQCTNAAPSRFAGECICKGSEIGRSTTVHLDCGHVNVTCAQVCHSAVPWCEIDRFGEIRCLTVRTRARGADTDFGWRASHSPKPLSHPLEVPSSLERDGSQPAPASIAEAASPGAPTPAATAKAASDAQKAQGTGSSLGSRIRRPAPVRKATALTRPPEAHGRQPCTPAAWAGSAPGLKECDFGIWVNRLHGPDAVALVKASRQRDRARMRDLGIPFADAPLALPADDVTLLRQEAVRRSIRHAWAGYTRYARGTDDLKPVSRQGHHGLCKMGVTAVDSIDTLLLADLPQEYLDARQWTIDELKFGTPEQEDINLFETTIRVVGGLLGAFELSQDRQFVDMAADVATRMASIAFQDPFGIPLGTIGLKSGKAFNPSWVSGASAVSEVGTLQLEFGYLSHLTGDSSLEKKGRRVMRHLERLNVTDGLYPIYLSPTTGKFMAVPVTLGARGDSVYEYLLKQWLQLHPQRSPGGRRARDWLRSMYTRSVRGILDRLLMHSAATGMAFISEQVLPADALKPDQSPKPLLKMDHLVCFAPGMLALGAMHRAGFAEGQKHAPRSGFFAGATAWDGKDGAYARLINVSLALLRTCNTMYTTTTTGLAPEIVTFYPSGPEMRPNHDALHSLLRPETVESMFVLWRVTKQPWIREAAWDIFVAVERHARVWSGGYSSVDTANWGATTSPAKAKAPATDSKRTNDAERPFSWAQLVVRSANEQERRRCRGDEAPVTDARCAWVPDGANLEAKEEPEDAVFEPDESGPRDTRNMRDHMESFFLAETLKYLYLIFSEDSVLPLDEYVFNTEAHPFRMV